MNFSKTKKNRFQSQSLQFIQNKNEGNAVQKAEKPEDPLTIDKFELAMKQPSVEENERGEISSMSSKNPQMVKSPK